MTLRETADGNPAATPLHMREGHAERGDAAEVGSRRDAGRSAPPLPEALRSRDPGPRPDPLEQAPSPDSVEEDSSVLDRILDRPAEAAARAGGALREATVSTWSGGAGVLRGGDAARLAASCLMRPAAGDQVLVWTGADGGSWVLGILRRQAGEEAPAVLATPGPLAIEASRLGIAARAVHLVAEDFLSNTHNRHAVERTRTETAHVRVAQVGTDIRRATNADDRVDGTLLQRTGTWISNTVHEARLRARTFLFD